MSADDAPGLPLIVRGRRVALPEGTRAADVTVRDGRIVSVDAHGAASPEYPVLDAGDFSVLPGLVDSHVHVNDPGRADWEGFESGTRAAAAGGVTTLIDMPLNSIPSTTTPGALEMKLAAAAGRCHVDVGFWGGVVPGNTGALEPLAARGVLGFKCFMSPSGVDEFEAVTEDELREALPVLARLKLPLLVHAEWPALLRAVDPAGHPRRYSTWLDSRPPESEHAAIDLLIRLAREYRAHVHVVHLASAGALDALRQARAGGVSISVETCPHYLSFAAEDIADGATAFKCAPPIRGRTHREGLWQALDAAEIDLVATDHSPAPAALKAIDSGTFVDGWGGIASLQLGLAAVWTGAAARGIPLDRVAGWMSAAPARLAGLHARKGCIAVGRDADLVFFDPDQEFTVDPSALHHRHPVTAYAGMRLRGRVRKTILRGEVIFDEGALCGRPRGVAILGRHPPS